MNQEIKTIVNEIRYRYGIPQREIAARLGVKESYLSDVVTGRRPFTEKFKAKIAETFPDLNGSEDNSLRDGGDCVPLVPIIAMGGPLSDYEDCAEEYECEWIPTPVRGATMAISVSGDSMAPEFPNGSTVIVKKIDERAFIEWGRTYVLDTVNGVVIKNLVPSEKGDGWVRCVSVNSAPQFAPFDVSLSDVRAIYRVVITMSMK